MRSLLLLLTCLALFLFLGCEKVTLDRSEFDMETPFVPKFDKNGKRIPGEKLFENDHDLRALRNTEIKDQLKPEEIPLFKSMAERLEARKFAEVKKTLELYLSKNPEGEGLYRAYYLKARCEYELGELDQAVETIRAAYDKSPANPYSIDLVRLLVETRKKQKSQSENNMGNIGSTP